MKRSTRVKGVQEYKSLGILLFYLCTLLLFYPSLTPAAEQARGFGTTMGAASTDRIVSALNSHATQRSYAMWVYRNGQGGGGNGRIFDKRVAGAQVEAFFNNEAVGVYQFSRAWSTTNGDFQIARPSTGGWHHYVITYDGGSASNVPIVYVDGVSVSVTTFTAPTGTLSTNSDSYVLGNRQNDNARVWDGILSQFAVWNRILTPTEAANLGTAAGAYNGWAPNCYTTNLVEYIKMNDNPVTSSLLANPTVTGTVQQTGLDIDYACGTTLGVTITSPTSSPTYDNGATSTITLGGASTGATFVAWSNDRGGSGSTSGVNPWTFAGIALLSGTNVITVTAGDGVSTVTDTITVTYTPAAGPASLIGHRQIK